MARNILAFADIFESSGEPLSPEDFVIILNGSQIKIILAFLESYATWKSSWEYPSDSQWDIIESYMADIYLRLGGEKVYDIKNSLDGINNTLTDIRDLMSNGDGSGEGNSLKDLIFWLKILLAVSGEGGAVTPLLGSVNGTLQSMNTAIIDNESNSSLAAIETAIRDAIEGRDTNTMDIVAAIESIDCGSGSGGVILPQNIVDNGQNLLRNGEWEEGDNRNIPGAFFPHYWLSAGNTSNGEYWTRGGSSGNYYISNVEEVNCELRQTAVIPSGYGLPKIIVESQAINLNFNLKVYVNNVLTQLSIVENTNSYYEADFYALPNDSVKIEFDAVGCNIARVGKVSLMVYPVGISQVIELPPVGGSMGKGYKKELKPSLKEWESTGNTDSLSNWLVEKVEALGDWLGLRLAASKTLARQITATRIIRIDASTKICNLSFNTSFADGDASVTIDRFNGSTWETVKNCTVQGAYSVKVQWPEAFGGEKLIKMTASPNLPINAAKDFWLWALETEVID